MRIVFLIQDCTTIGGTERVTCCLSSEMARQGNEVAIISVFGVDGHCKFELDSRVKFVVASNEDYNLRMNKFHRLAKVGKMTDMIESNALMREADVVIAQKFFAAMLAVNAGYKDKLIVGDHYPYAVYSRPLLKLRDYIYRKAKMVVVLTDAYRKEYEQHLVKNVTVIENMVPIPVEYVEGAREKVILAVGRLAREKGFDTLLEAIALIDGRLGEWKVEICGEGDERAKLEEMINNLGLQNRVVLRGAVADISAEYRRASFGVMPSHFEGFPMVLLEAAAKQLPMVAFDCPYGPKSILSHGGGVLVENQNVVALANAILHMADNSVLRKKCSEETRNIVEKYSPEKIYQQWIQIIEKCL